MTTRTTRPAAPLPQCAHLSMCPPCRRLVQRLSDRVAAAAKVAPPKPTSPLTERQRQVVQHAANGLTRDQIGQQMGLATNTIKTHLRVAAARTGAQSTTNLTAIAIRAGWVE